MQYIEERGSPFSTQCPPVLHNFVTKEVMTQDIRNDVLNVSERGKKKFETFYSERFTKKTSKLSDTIHKENLKTMITVKNKSKKTTKKVIRELHMNEKSIEIARDRGLLTKDILMYDVVPSPMLFDDDRFMTKPEKSELICVLEEKLESGDYSYHHQPGSAFLIDVMATVRRIPLVGLSDFSGLLTKFTEMTDMYHTYGSCDYIFDIYDDTPSVKDSERLRRASVAPVELSSVELTTPLHKDMTTFWPSNKNKFHLETLVYRQICHQSSDGGRHPTMLSQLCTDINEWQCVKVHNGTKQCMDHLQTTLKEADLRISMHVLDCVRAGYSTCVVLSNNTDVIVALLYYVPMFRKEGLKELWVRAGRGNTTRFVPLHILHDQHGIDLCKVLPALHSLTGCDITSKIGTKKAALKSSPEIHLQEFGTSAEISSVQIHHAQHYLVNVVKSGSNASSFTDLRRELFHFSKSTSHQNLPPTSQGLEPHIRRAFFNA